MLRTLTVRVPKPKDVDVNVRGVHTLQHRVLRRRELGNRRRGGLSRIGQRTLRVGTLTAGWRVVLAESRA